MILRVLMLVFLAGVLWLIPGCPAMYHFEQPLDRQPRQLDRFDKQFPDAQSVTYYRTRRAGGGELHLERTTDYHVHFQLNETWYVARYNASGWLKSVDPAEAEYDWQNLRH